MTRTVSHSSLLSYKILPNEYPKPSTTLRSLCYPYAHLQGWKSADLRYCSVSIPRHIYCEKSDGSTGSGEVGSIGPIRKRSTEASSTQHVCISKALVSPYQSRAKVSSGEPSTKTWSICPLRHCLRMLGASLGCPEFHPSMSALLRITDLSPRDLR